MKEFFYSLLSDKVGSLSIKRFGFLIGCFVIYTIALVCVFFKFTVEEFIYIGLISFVASLVVANVAQSMNKKSGQIDIATSLIENEDTSNKTQETVKEIIK